MLEHIPDRVHPRRVPPKLECLTGPPSGSVDFRGSRSSERWYIGSEGGASNLLNATSITSALAWLRVFSRALVLTPG